MLSFFQGLKGRYTFGNCQRPVSSLGVSHHKHKITSLWKFEHIRNPSTVCLFSIVHVHACIYVGFNNRLGPAIWYGRNTKLYWMRDVQCSLCAFVPLYLLCSWMVSKWLCNLLENVWDYEGLIHNLCCAMALAISKYRFIKKGETFLLLWKVYF